MGEKQKRYWDEVRAEIAAMDELETHEVERRSPAAELKRQLFGPERQRRIRRDHITTIMGEVVARYGSSNVADVLNEVATTLRQEQPEVAIAAFCDRLLPRLN